MKTLTLPLLMLIAGVSFTSCRKHTSSPDNTGDNSPTQGPYLYVGGNTINAKAAYWKKSLSQPNTITLRDTLTDGKNITSIVTSGSDIYMSVFGTNGGYWKNNTLVTLPNCSSVSNITLSGTTVYASGWDKMLNLAYWIGNTKYTLDNPYNLFPDMGVGSSGLTGIALSGPNVLVSGSLSVSNRLGAPANALDGDFGMVWANGNLSLLGKGGLPIFNYHSTVGIAVAGADVYVAGRFPDTTHVGGYWKNRVWDNVNNGAFLPSSIITSGSDVYIAGATYTRNPVYSQQAAYWVNGNLIQLTGSVATAIAVDGQDVYILGIDNNNKVVVWKNGNNVFTTIGSDPDVGADCIAIGN